MPSWSRTAPDHAVVMTDEDGSIQAWAWDVATNERRRITDEPVGLIIQEGADAIPSADGERVIWFSDTTGNEAGRWLTAPFTGLAPGEQPQPLLEDVPEAWYSGLAVGQRTVAMGLGFDDGFRIYVSRDGGPARVLHSDAEELRVTVPEWGGPNLAALSADERYLCIAHCEEGDILHYALRVYDLETFEAVGDVVDIGMNVWACAWSPIPGDARLLIRTERTGFLAPAIWDIDAAAVQPLAIGGLTGEVDAYDWWPDASAVLLARSRDARGELYRAEVATGETTRIPHPDGCLWGGGVRPDGSVWYCLDAGSRATRILAATPEGGERDAYVPRTSPDAVLDGHPYVSRKIANRHGEEVQGFLITPTHVDPPYPLFMDVHGGPAWFWGDYWSPKTQALVDAGIAVALVNYRGSATFGRDWRDRLIGDVGFPETEDLNDWTDALIAEGYADPKRLILGGPSWGGYLTLLGVGMHPERWAAGVATVPVGDYIAAYEDSAPSLQAMDRGYLGAPPGDIPDFIIPRSPITYVDQVRCPLYIIYGENDSRCPPRQVENYIEALRAVGGEPEVHTYGTGHSSHVTDEATAQAGSVLDFLARVIPGIDVPA